jgi:hypothetical protein
MADDFGDIRDRMKTHLEVVQLFYFTVGITLHQCQAFEDRLRQYKIVVFDSPPGTTAQVAEQLLAKSRKRDTLGSLLKALGRQAKIEAKTQALLDEFLAERNWFIHHFEIEHGMVAFDATALTPVVQRMRDLQQRSIHLQKQFAELTLAWVEKHGVSRDRVDAAARAALDIAIKPL